MRKLIFAVLLFLLINSSFGQISLKLYNYRPTGEFGFVMKPTYSAELGYMGSFENRRLRICASLTYLEMKPRMDVFPIYGLLSGGNGDQVLPGTQSFQKYNIAQLHAGVDFAFLKLKKYPFYMYGGADLIVGTASVRYTDYVETLEDASYDGGGFTFGFRFRLGAEYDINENIGVFINAERSVWQLTDPAALNWVNDYGVGVKYEF